MEGKRGSSEVSAASRERARWGKQEVCGFYTSASMSPDSHYYCEKNQRLHCGGDMRGCVKQILEDYIHTV